MPAQFVTLPVFLCGAASLAISAVLIGLPSRERLAEQNDVPWRLLTAALILATGLKGAQWTALGGLTPLPAPYWAADWAVAFALTFTFLFWYPRHATGRAAHITPALLLTVILAQLPLWHWTTLPAAAYVTAAGLLLLGGAVSLGGSLLLRQVKGGAFPIGVISVSQGLLITLVTLAFTAPLHGLSSTAPLTPSLTASWMKAMFLIAAFSLIVREVQVRRARRFQQQVGEHVGGPKLRAIKPAERVRAGPARQPVHTRAPIDQIVAIAAVDPVDASPAFDPIIARATDEQPIAGASESEPVDPVVAEQHSVARALVCELVVADAADQQRVARAGVGEPVFAVAADDAHVRGKGHIFRCRQEGDRVVPIRAVSGDVRDAAKRLELSKRQHDDRPRLRAAEDLVVLVDLAFADATLARPAADVQPQRASGNRGVL